MVVAFGAAQAIRRCEFASRDPDETTEFFRRMYVGNHTAFRHVDPQGGLNAQVAAVATLRADRVRGPLTMDVTGDPLGYVLFGQLHRGRWMLRAGGEEARLVGGDSILYPCQTGFELEAQDFDFTFVMLSLEHVAALAAAHTDLKPGQLRFHSMRPISTALARHCTRILAMLHRELSAAASTMLNPLVVEQLCNIAGAAVLATFPNTTMTTEHVPGAGHVAPASLRRAVAFIDAHAHEPITLADIAAAGGIRPRTLQAGFARHYDTTPMAYLREVRLERAHHELQAADLTRGDTVAGIATRWGFIKPGRFAAAYKQHYGVLPSQTLRT